MKPLAYRLPSGHLITTRDGLIIATTKRERKHMAKRFPAWQAVPFKTITVSAWEAQTDGR